MLGTASSRAAGPFQVVAYLDEDDETRESYPALPSGSRYVVGPRIVQSDMWNKCWAEAEGDIAMLGGDDMQFRTQGWDRHIEGHFASVPDRLLMVWADDGTRLHEPTLPFVSREWIEVSGFFTPPYFRSWMADRWLWEVAESIDRDRFMPRVKIEHPNMLQRRHMDDQTYRDGARFRQEQDPKALYLRPEMLRERQSQAMRLCEAIHSAGAWAEPY